MKRRNIILGIVVVAAGLFLLNSVFTVHEREQALVLQFGNPIRPIQEPGLNFKMPWQSVEFMEKRILDFDAPPEEIIASDKKRIVVDGYARFQIANPLVFFQTVSNEVRARQRLATIINSSLRQVLATVELNTILSGERVDLMHRISDSVNVEAAKLGIRIVDVRIKRADLPTENSQAVYRRMQAEREREAQEARARGEEESRKIRADADRQRTVLIAEAQRESEILRGTGDAERNRIFAEAYGQDSEFFQFYRSLQAYRRALSSDDTTMVLTPDSSFFRYFLDRNGGVKAVTE